MLISHINLNSGVLCLLSIFLALPVSSTPYRNYPAGSRSAALSHATTALSDVWSTFHNQAGLAEITDITSALYYESRFGIPELSVKAASALLPFEHGTLGISILRFGLTHYSEYKAGLACAIKLSEKMNAGIQLDYLSQSTFKEEFNSSCATFEGGILFKPISTLSTGVHIFSPVSLIINNNSDSHKVPMIIKSGLCYHFEKWLLMSIDFVKEYNYPLYLRSGIEFHPVSQLVLRLGISKGAQCYTTGLGVMINRVIIDMGVSYDIILGATPSISVEFHL